jgi:hypothetical protein
MIQHSFSKIKVALNYKFIAKHNNISCGVPKKKVQQQITIKDGKGNS